MEPVHIGSGLVSARPTLLGIPLEIRRKIYGYLFTGIVFSDWASPRDRISPRHHLAILETNKQLHEEAELFALSSPVTLDYQPHFPRGLLIIPKTIASHVSHVTLGGLVNEAGIWACDLNGIAQEYPNVRIIQLSDELLITNIQCLNSIRRRLDEHTDGGVNESNCDASIEAYLTRLLNPRWLNTCSRMQHIRSLQETLKAKELNLEFPCRFAQAGHLNQGDIVHQKTIAEAVSWPNF